MKIGISAWIVAAEMLGVFVERELILGDRRQVDFDDLRVDLLRLGLERLALFGVELAGAEPFARCFKHLSEMALRRAGKGYVLGVKSNQLFHSWGKPQLVAGSAKDIADDLPASAWRRLSAGAGTKGERLHDWASLELSDLDAGDYNEALTGQAWTRGLLIRRKIADGDLAFFTTWAPRGTTIERLAKIEGHRWAIADSFERTKNELGLDHNETRSWHGWRRHVSLVMLAFAMMAAIRVHAKQSRATPKNNAPVVSSGS